MTVEVESERQLHHPRIYIPKATNIVSLYTLSNLLQSQQQAHIYYESTGESQDDELIKKICPRAVKAEDVKGMERSIVYLQEGAVDETELRAPVEGYHRFVLIVSFLVNDSDSFEKLENEAKSAGYESYCILRLPPVYQDLSAIDVSSEDTTCEFYGIDAEDAGSAISHILLDPELHRSETYTIYNPASISLSTLKTVQSQLPHPPGPTLHAPETILKMIKGFGVEKARNDFARITGGEEMTSFEEFLRRAHQSLFHQRFIARI